MKITNCNTMEKVVCGCTPAFSSYVNNSTSVLDVGNLTGGSCTFTSYVIDWYRNGTKGLVSGTNGASPDVAAVHPFTGAAAIPVPGGTWVPVIRWVVIGGIKYYSQPTKCKKWCNTLTGLPTITVNSLSCGITNTSGDYQYLLSYTTTQDFSLATRTLRWDLASDTKYLAVNFAASVVADRIDIFYKDETVPISSWISGSNYNYTQVEYLPYRITGSAKFVLTLREFQTGDFLTIKITPSVLEVNTNTIWSLNIKCLTASSDFAAECALLNQQARPFPDVSTFAWVDQIATNCRVLFNFSMGAPVLITAYFPNLVKYAGLGYSTQGLLNSAAATTTGDLSALFSRSYGGNSNSCVTPVACTNLLGSVSLSKTGNVFTITFTNQSDYDFDKARYAVFQASSCVTTYSTDVTLVAHYHFVNYTFRVTNLCGDTFVDYSIYGHVTSPITFDDANKRITIEVLNVTNQYVPVASCDSTSSQITSYINIVANTINNFSPAGLTTTYVRYRGWDGSRVNTVITNNTSAFAIVQFSMNVLCSPCYPDRMCTSKTYTYQKLLYSVGLFIKITNDADRANNFEVWCLYDHDTGCGWGNSSNDYQLHYRVKNGVVTYPMSGRIYTRSYVEGTLINKP